MTKISKEDLEKMDDCLRHNDQKAKYYCIKSDCAEHEQRFYCDVCQQIEKRHGHLSKTVISLTQVEGKKWIEVHKQFCDINEGIKSSYKNSEQLINLFD